MGRGQPVGPALATSSDGGGIAANSIAARPVQVFMALRPGCSVTAHSRTASTLPPFHFSRCLPACSPSVLFPRFDPIGGQAI